MTINFRGIRSDFSFLCHFFDENQGTKQIAPYGTPRFAASHLGLFYLPMSNKKDARLILVKATCVYSSALPSKSHGLISLISNRKAINRNWSNQKANPALKTKAGNKLISQIDKIQ